MDEEQPGRRSTAKLLTMDEAWQMAVNFAKLPELLPRPTLGLSECAATQRHVRSWV
jgi:hypothetical protein